MSSGERYDVFLCHNSEDAETVREICRELRRGGLRPWLAEEQLRPGVAWQRALEEQIRRIDAAAVFVGPTGIGPWQRVEIETFLQEFVERSCPVIPVLLADSGARPSLPAFLRQMTWVDFRSGTPDPFAQLIWGITGTRPAWSREDRVVPGAGEQGEALADLVLRRGGFISRREARSPSAAGVREALSAGRAGRGGVGRVRNLWKKISASRSDNVVGLDIGSSSIKLVELKELDHSRFQLQHFGLEPLPREAIVDGTIMDSSRVVDAIRKLVRTTGVQNSRFATSLSGSSVLVKKIELPAMELDELSESIQWEAEQHLPYNVEDVRLDYVVLSEDDPSRETMEVLIVAVKREKVNAYVSVISQSGLSPMIIDVDAFAIQNAYELNYDLDSLKVVALVNLGAEISNINIVARGQTVFWRDLSFGGSRFTEALQRELDLSFDEAELLKRGDAVGRYSVREAGRILDRVSSEMAAEIQETFDAFTATSSEAPVDGLVLSGGCSLTPNLGETLGEQLGVPAEWMNPFRQVVFDEAKLNRHYLDSIAPMFSIAVGLALRKVGD